MRGFLPALVAITMITITPSYAAVVGTYTLSLPPAESVVMGDSIGILDYTLTNDPGNTNNIDYVRFDFDGSVYYLSSTIQAPPGWSVSSINNQPTRARVIFLASGAGITPGNSADFSILLTGSLDGPITPDVSDMSDSMTGILIKEGSAGNNTFSGNNPAWTRHSLYTQLSASPSAVGIGENITLQMAVTNRTTVSQSGIRPGAITVSGSGSVNPVSGPTPASATIPVDEQRIFTYTYQAATAGTVTFSGSAWEGLPGNVTSPTITSNEVVIGEFTAQMDVSSLQVSSGQQVTVTMTLTNSGTSALTVIIPQISTSGTAVFTLDSGPLPSAIAVLGPGNSVTVQWLYTITGNVGDTYQFTGWATSSTITSTNGISDQGIITEYSVIVVPSSVTSGATGVSLNFEVSNNGALPLRQVTITTTPGWTYVSSSGPPGWAINVGGSPTGVRYRNASTPIPVGGSETFTVIYDVPSVGSPTEYNFLVEVWDTITNYNWSPTGSVEVPVMVMPYEIVLTSSISPSFPTPPIADGVQYYDLIATLNGPAGAVSWAPIIFTTTAGSLGNGTVVTDALGEAPNTLTGPLSNTPVSATVQAEYLGAFATTVLTFDPFTGVAMDYIPGSMLPLMVTPGEPAVIFSVTVINSGTWSVTLDTASTFSFSDTSVGGSSTYLANLNNSNPGTVNPGSTSVLTFQAANVPATFFTGDFFPALFLVEGGSSGTRPVSDSVKVFYYPDLVVLKSSSVFSDPVNSTVNPKAIPLATVQYTVLVTNTGLGWADSNTVQITDAVAANSELFVGDMGLAGSGPVIFSDGSPASGLTYNFTALGSPADDLEFSNNGGGSYIYLPSPDADGYDSAVTNFRVNPEGRLSASDGVNNPNFSIIFRVRIQ